MYSIFLDRMRALHKAEKIQGLSGHQDLSCNFPDSDCLPKSCRRWTFWSNDERQSDQRGV